MGTDTPIAPLSTRPRLLYDYFHQLFAQVTNPPLDAIREELVTSLSPTIGPEGNLLDPGAGELPADRAAVPGASTTTSWPRSSPSTRTATCPASRRSGSPGSTGCATARPGIKARLTEICRHVSEAIEDGVRILVLSDRDSTADLAPIPSLLLTAAVHQHLVREQTRTQVALIVESGDCREVHHVARADRLRRGRGQPVPGLRDRRGPDRHRRADRHRRRRRRCATTSRRWARAS